MNRHLPTLLLLLFPATLLAGGIDQAALDSASKELNTQIRHFSVTSQHAFGQRLTYGQKNWRS